MRTNDIAITIARWNRGAGPRTKILSPNRVLVLVLDGYEISNKIPVDVSMLPKRGDITVSWLEDPSQTEEVLNVIRLRSKLTPVGTIAHGTPTAGYLHEYNADNMKFMSMCINGDRNTNYRHVIWKLHDVITGNLNGYLSSENEADKKGAMIYLQQLGRPSPLWEEQTRALLIEEQNVLQAMIKQIRGGLAYVKFHISNKIRSGHFEKLVSLAIAGARDKNKLLEQCYYVSYDVDIEHYIHGPPGETLLAQLEAWAQPPLGTDDDSFRIDSNFMTNFRKHPMQRLDELGERFFRGFIESNQSGEVLYTRAVLCRSLLITTFFQTFLEIWDDCLLNGHLKGLDGLVPIIPKLTERIKCNTMGIRSIGKISPPIRFVSLSNEASCEDSGSDEASRSQPDVPRNPSPVETSIDVEMVDAGPLSDLSSDTVIHDEKAVMLPVAAMVPAKKTKSATRAEKRRNARKTRQNVAVNAELNVESIINIQVDEESSKENRAGLNSIIQERSQSLLGDLGIGIEKLAERPIDANSLTLQSGQQINISRPIFDEEAAPNSKVVSKSMAKRLRRKARAAATKSPANTVEELSVPQQSACSPKSDESAEAELEQKMSPKQEEHTKIHENASSGVSTPPVVSVQVASTSEEKANDNGYNEEEAIQQAVEASMEDAWKVVERKPKKVLPPPKPTRRGRGRGGLKHNNAHGQIIPRQTGAGRPGEAAASKTKGHAITGGSTPSTLNSSHSPFQRSQGSKRGSKRSSAYAKAANSQRLPVLHDLEEFPTLEATTEKIVARRGSNNSTERLAKTVESALTPMPPVDEADAGKARSPDGKQNLNDKESVHACPDAPIPETEPMDQAVSAERTDSQLTPQSTEPLTVAQNNNVVTEKGEAINPAIEVPDTKARASIVILEDKINFKSLTKKERRAAAKKAAEGEGHTPKLSAKERIAIKRLSAKAKAKDLKSAEKPIPEAGTQPEKSVGDEIKSTQDDSQPKIGAMRSTPEDTDLVTPEKELAEPTTTGPTSIEVEVSSTVALDVDRNSIINEPAQSDRSELSQAKDLIGSTNGMAYIIRAPSQMRPEIPVFNEGLVMRLPSNVVEQMPVQD
ncbi:hypothetical protein ABW19_dt0201509 [Dactylella cylindrospora]|nr:hypothetical protein ABW19_dt0201509 [Dactylella cylindrospora]